MTDGRAILSSVICDLTPGQGALAQLGERLICIQEVSGSIPLGSTIQFAGSSLQF